MIDSHAAPIRLIDALNRLHGRLREAFASVREATGLSDMEHTVLAAVVEARSPPTVPKIGRSLGHPRQVIQRAANGLLAKGLIENAENPDHKRASLLIASGAGHAVQAKANRKAEAISAAILRHIDAAQIIAAIEQIETIRAGIEAGVRKAQP